jgi:hypothetical protein
VGQNGRGWDGHRWPPQFWRTKDGRVYPQVSLNAYNATNRVTFGDPDMTFGSRSATLAAELHF